MAILSFVFRKAGTNKTLRVSIPTNGVFVVTNEFCPKEFLVGGFLSFVTPIQQELQSEFVKDCENQVLVASRSSKADIVDAHVDGLLDSVNSHINRCGRLFFNDLLLYVDCFAYLLKGHGYSDDFIKKKYIETVKKIVREKNNYLKDSQTLQPFNQTMMYLTVMHK